MWPIVPNALPTTVIVGYSVYLACAETETKASEIPLKYFLIFKRPLASKSTTMPCSLVHLRACWMSALVDTATVFTTGGYHMSRAKPGGMISAFV